jgi:hypothetical protein
MLGWRWIVTTTEARCPTCDRAMPTLDDVAVSVGEAFDQSALVAITFHVRCDCGEEVGLCMRTEDADDEKGPHGVN